MRSIITWTASVILSLSAPVLYAEDNRAETDATKINAGQSEACAGECVDPLTSDVSPFAGKLTGDWGGSRSSLAESGITFDASVTQFYSGVTRGGREQVFRYSGHGEYVLNTDFGKLGMQEGLSLRMRAEHRFGTPITTQAGVLLPPYFNSVLPTTATEDLVLSEVLFTQFLSENVAVSAGKVNTFTTGLTPFTSGRGDDTFMNMNAYLPRVLLSSVPLSTLGAGITIFKDKFPLLMFNVLNSQDTTTQSGFDRLFEDGVSLFGVFNLPTPIDGKMGVQSFGFSWNNKQQTALGQDPRLILQTGTVQQLNESWSLFWSGFQYVQTYDDPKKGWGVFGSAGISDGNPTITRYSLTFGLGGFVPFCHRPNDRFGVMWFYNGLTDETGPVINTLLRPQDSNGVELFYNIAVTPSFYVTPDLQILKPGLSRNDTAILFALRAKIDF